VSFYIGQEYFSDGSAIAGFNRRVSGQPHSQAFAHDNERHNGPMQAGWNHADKLVAEGKVFSLNLGFHHTHENCSRTWSGAFHYGGFVVCNGCGRKDIDKDWWWIKCFMDGNAWMCHGPGFEDLQASSNFAFGATREEAIKNYGDVMTAQASTESQPREAIEDN
jgi:hypothetical protein